MTSDVLTRLAQTIHQRRNDAPGSSYTRQLLDHGPARCARKFGEEAIELVIAAVGQGPTEVASEAADVVYHMLVLLESRGVALEDVLGVLESRMGTSGLDEKAARARG